LAIYFFLSGISIIAINCHTLDFAALSTILPFYPTNIIESIAIFLFLGAVGKSAQIGLHT